MIFKVRPQHSNHSPRRIITPIRNCVSSLLERIRFRNKISYDTVTINKYAQENGTYGQVITVVRPKTKGFKKTIKYGEPVEMVTDFNSIGKPVSEIKMTRYGWESKDFNPEGEEVNQRSLTYKTPLKYFGGDGYFA